MGRYTRVFGRALRAFSVAWMADGNQLNGNIGAMRTTIDAAGRLVVPKPLRDQLGLAPGTELELRAVDGRLEIAVPSRVRVEDGPKGVRFIAEGAESLSAAQVRELMEQVRR